MASPEEDLEERLLTPGRQEVAAILIGLAAVGVVVGLNMATYHGNVPGFLAGTPLDDPLVAGACVLLLLVPLRWDAYVVAFAAPVVPIALWWVVDVIRHVDHHQLLPVEPF